MVACMHGKIVAIASKRPKTPPPPDGTHGAGKTFRPACHFRTKHSKRGKETRNSLNATHMDPTEQQVTLPYHHTPSMIVYLYSILSAVSLI